MARDSRLHTAPPRVEGAMQGSSGFGGGAPGVPVQSSPHQLFESARRAVQDGQLAVAEQILRHLVATSPQSPEGMAAQNELGRLVRHRAAVEGGSGQPYAPAPQAQPPQVQPPHVQPMMQPVALQAAPQPQALQPAMMQQPLQPMPQHASPQPAGYVPAGTPAYAPQPYAPAPTMPDNRFAEPLRADMRPGGFAPGDFTPGDRAPTGDGMPAVVTGGKRGRRSEPAAAAEPHNDAALARPIQLTAPKRYKFGRFLSIVIGLTGWFTILVGFALVGANVAVLLKIKLPTALVQTLGYTMAIQTILAGCLLVLVRQVAKAVFDAAANAHMAASIAEAQAGLPPRD